MARYVVQANLGSSGLVIITAGTQGLTIVDCEVSLGVAGPAELDVVRGALISGGSPLAITPLREGDVAALSTATTGGSNAGGPNLGRFAFSSIGVCQLRLFRKHPVYVAPGGGIEFQTSTGNNMELSLYVEE